MKAGLLDEYRRDIQRQAGLRQAHWDKVVQMRQDKERFDPQIAVLDDILGKYNGNES